jgi:hypothetical protein
VKKITLYNGNTYQTSMLYRTGLLWAESPVHGEGTREETDVRTPQSTHKSSTAAILVEVPSTYIQTCTLAVVFSEFVALVKTLHPLLARLPSLPK